MRELLSEIKRQPVLLVVEDNEQDRVLLAEVLRGLACKVEYVFTAEDALVKLSTTPYEIILIDIRLGPGMNGFQLLDEILRLDIKVWPILLSGISDCFGDNLMEKYTGKFVTVCRKPFTRSAAEYLFQRL